MGPDLWELFEDGNGDDEVAAIVRLGRSSILPKGVRVVTQFSEIITIRTSRANIPNLSGSPEVADIAAGDTYLGPDLEAETADFAELSSDTILPTDERRPSDEKATGRGVVVGSVDWGFDFAHPDFLNADGTTRILALWDQRGSRLPNSPQPFGYGVVHSREEINRALKQKDPYAALGYHPADADTGIGCHGTHVLSIAAGGGGQDRPKGIAPEADLVLVHNAPWDELDTGRLGDSVTLLEAIDFISRTAADHPWVINLSMGRHGEQHDGSTLIEQGLDAAIRTAPGRAICLSAGNYFDKRIHASGQLRPTQERTIVWEILEGKPTNNQLEFWYSWQDKFQVTVRSPDGSIDARAGIGERSKFMVGGKEVGNVYHRGQEPNNLDNHITIYLYKEAPAGEWEVTLIGTDVIDGRYHAWVERDVACASCQSRLRPEDADPKSTTGTICNGRRTIAVGAYNKHDPEMRVAHFSSVGPTRDGRLKPDLCAPGVSVLAARSAPREQHDRPQLLTRMSGTSMAAPHVTGAVALMFQAAPRRLRIEETHNLLLQSARKVSVPEEVTERIGIGFLDIEAAVEAARQTRPSSATFKQTTVQSSSTPKAHESELDARSREENAWLSATELFEGRADGEYDSTEAIPHQNTFHRIANDITSAFEGGKTGTLNLYDLGVISYGKHQATLHSGTLLGILKRFSELSSSAISAKLATYLDRVKQRDETLREDPVFIGLLKDAAKEPEMDQAQDEEFGRQYWEPAKTKAAMLNVKSALGHAIFYDTKIQGGLEEVAQSVLKKLGGKIGRAVDGQEISELDSLRTFVDERIQRNLRISARQRKQSLAFNQAAQDLEDAVAAASDPAQAEDLRKRAAENRKQAKVYAANAAALDTSSTKTRGPSFTELVASGDLNLYDGDAGKIMLKGKPGVAIDSLRPGAAIDATTPAPEAAQPALSDSDSVDEMLESFDESATAGQTDAFGSEVGSNLASTVPVCPRTDGADWVELADQIVAGMDGGLPSVRVLHEMFERSEDLDDLAEVAGGGQPTAAQIFDSFVYSKNSPLGEHLGGNFELLALPSESLEGGVRPGDIMVRRAEGPAAHVSVIATSGLKTLEGLAAEGLTSESRSPGKYVQVVEGGSFPHDSGDKYARQLTDSFGRVLNDIVLLRLATPPPPVIITQGSPKDDPFASVQEDGAAETVTDQEALSDNTDYFEMTEVPPVVSSHQITLNGALLKYTATAGRLPIKNSNGQIEAEMFFVAYTLDNQDSAKRPLTFAFNGGPGSASLWLHIGALGPRKVVLQPDGFLPPAPYRIENNPYTMLDKSDLVLIDAIGTGFSRASNSDTFRKFWGVRGDILAFSEFIRLYITRNQRWGSPLFLMGESYGTMRAAGIAGYLDGKGISFNGITLLSTVLNYETLEATKTNDQPYVFLIPTFTMIAGFHHKLPASLLLDMNRARQAAEKWASGDYAQALAKGDALTPAERQRIIEQMAYFTGLSKEIIDQANLRIDVSKFTHNLLLDKKLRVGRFDGRFTGPDPEGLLDTQFYDPTEAATHPPFTSVFNNYLRSELGYKTDMPYYTRAQDADSETWNWGSAIAGFPDTATALRQAIIKNPYLKILVLEGLYDLATPFSAANYTVDHLELPPKFRGNVSVATYEAGHMVYLPEAGLKKLKADLAIFTEQSATTHALAPGESLDEQAAVPGEDDVSVLAMATREVSLQAIGDGTQGQLPKDILEGILIHGADDANDLANTVFWRQHPDLAGRALDPDDPKQQVLRSEWSVIFRLRVKPMIWLRAMIEVLDRFRGTLPRDFLLGWMAVESDGFLAARPNHLNDELGYFQIMWSSGEAKLQLRLSEKEFAKLATDAEFSIEKGVALAEAYRRHILETYPSVPDCSDLLWRLVKGRHAASGALKSVLDTLVRTPMPITWNTASRRMPASMIHNITHTMEYAAKLKPFADLVPTLTSAPCAPSSGSPGAGTGSAGAAGGGTFLEWGERSGPPAEDTGILSPSDDRVRVTPTTQPPWRWVCNVELLDSLPSSTGPERGTGVLISDRHVLTAAHVVWDGYENPARFSVKVFPGRDFGDTFDGYLASKVRVSPNYHPSNDDADQWDYALITLDKAIGKTQFDAIKRDPLRFWGADGFATRFTMSPSDALTMSKFVAVTAGYPRNKDSGRELWCAKGRLHSVSLKGNPNIMRTTASMTRGQSGGPVWIQIEDQLCMVGIAIIAGTKMNRVLRVSPEMIGNLRAWFSADGETPWMTAPSSQRSSGKTAAAEVRSRDVETEEAQLAENGGPDAPLVETFPSVEFLDQEEFVKIIMVRETPRAPNLLEETIVLDSRDFSATESSELAAINGVKTVVPANPSEANYQLKWKGRIYYPRGAKAGSVAGTRTFPVAILLHGQHDWRKRATGVEIDNHLGYEYLQKELASRGIVSLSIGTNPANLLDSRIRTRAEFVLEGLRILKKLHEQVGHLLYQRLDLNNVGLMGHSRGGDAVVKAAILNRGSVDFTIRAVCSLAPTDFTGKTNAPLGLQASDGLRYFVLYGSHDGDVGGQFGDFTGTGFRHYDRATCERGMAFVRGAKHDRFNTEWKDNAGYCDPFDCAISEPEALAPGDHLQLAIDYIGGLFRLELNHENSLKGLFNGSTAPTGAPTVAFQWSPPRAPRTVTILTHGTPLEPSTQWTTGWTTLMPVRLPGTAVPFELGYKQDTGEVTIDQIDVATGTTSIWTGKWSTGWSHFMPFFMPGDDRQHDLAYKAGTGEIAIDRIARNGKSVEVNIWKDKWPTGWTSFVPVRLQKDSGAHFLVYNAGTGDVALHRINPIGKGTVAIFKASWSTGWTNFMPFLLPGDGRPCYLAYKQSDGTVDIDRIDADGKNIKNLWTGSRPPGWTSFVPFRVPGDDATYFLAYRKDTGEVSVDRINRDGGGTETVWKDNWTTNWSHFLTIEEKGKPYFLGYKVDQGDVAIGRLLPDKMLEVEDFEDRGVVAYDPAHDRLNGPASSSGLTRILFNAAVGPTPIAVQHQTFLLKGIRSGAKFRAEIPLPNRACAGFDLLTFRMASEFDLGSDLLIAGGKFPDFKVRVAYGRAGGNGVGTAEATQVDIDGSAVRSRQRPFFRKIKEFTCKNGTKIALQTIAIPLSKFAGVNWQDVRSIEFESGAGISSPFYFDSLALVQS